MKAKSKKALLRKKHEIRFHSVIVKKKNRLVNVRHPAYVFLEKGNLYIYVSLTHSEKIDGLLLIKLRKNPDPDDNQDSYWIVEIKDDIKSSFSRSQRNWKISEADDEDIRLFFKETKIKR